jgi:Zn-dependent protease
VTERALPALGRALARPRGHALTLRGVPITADITWLLGLGLAAWTFAGGVLPAAVPGRQTAEYTLAGSAAALLLLGSLVLHEGGHWMAARRAGLPVTGLRLTLMGGALTLGAAPRTPGAEARVAAAGPLASLGAAAGAALAHVVLVELDADPLLATVPALVVAGNLLVTAVNLLPGLPLDGGRVLRAVLWRATGDAAAATRVAHRAGRLVAGALVVLAVVASASGDAGVAVWAGLLAVALDVSAPAATA